MRYRRECDGRRRNGGRRRPGRPAEQMGRQMNQASVMFVVVRLRQERPSTVRRRADKVLRAVRRVARKVEQDGYTHQQGRPLSKRQIPRVSGGEGAAVRQGQGGPAASLAVRADAPLDRSRVLDDLETALRAAGYSPPTVDDDRVLVIRARLAAGVSWKVDGTPDQEPEVRRILRDCAKRIEEAGAAQSATDTRPRLVPKHDGDCTVWCHDGRCYETSTLTARELADRLAQLEDALGRVA